MIDGSHSRKYYVIFQGSDLKHWALNRLNPYFKHVQIACKSEGGYFWIVTNPMGGNIFNDIFPADDSIRSYFPDAVILETWSKPHPKPKARWWHINCVEIAKKMLGIRSVFVLTPYQLYKFIKGNKNG